MALLEGILVLMLGLVGAAGISFLQRTCPIDPVSVEYGPLGSAGRSWSREYNLEALEKIFVGPSPEDVAVDSLGNVYTGVADGWIKRIGVDGVVENFTHHRGGPILGLAFGPEDKIYLADGAQGLFVISKDGTESLLSNEVDGSAIRLADGVAVAKDGTIYFTDASNKFVLDESILDLLEGRPNGRLLKYDPSSGSTSVLANEMWFPNGVALSENEDFLLISETSRARLLRYWLKGEKEGTLDIFVEDLPGLPDNVRFSILEKVFYVGLVNKRNQKLDWAMRSSSKLLRCLMANPVVVSLLRRDNKAMLITISPEGKLVSKFEDPTENVVPFVTGGIRVGDFVYISGIDQDFLGRFKL